MGSIRLVGFSADEKRAFCDALRSSVQTPNPSPSPPPPPVPVIAPPAPAVATLSESINGVYFEVALGSLTHEHTKAIVNPSNEKLDLTGNLAAAIVAEGGSIIEQECQAHQGIPSGGAVVTKGGALGCLYVVHIVSPGTLYECVQAVWAAIQAAALNSLESIAFPPLGVVGNGLPLDQVAGIMVDTLAEAAKENDIGGLQLIRLVGYTAQEKDAFETALNQAVKGNRNIDLPPVPPPPVNIVQPAKGTQAQNNGTLINGVFIEVIKGDITEECSHAIVNPTDSSLGLTGRLSQAIVAKGGPTIKKECEKIGVLKDAVLTSAGKLKSKYIIHALSPANISGLQNTLRAVLLLAASKKFKSLSIPPIGVSRSVPLAKVAQYTTKEIVLAARQKTLNAITNIRLVAFTGEESAELESALEDAIAHKGKDLKDGINAVMVSYPPAWVPLKSNETWKSVPIKTEDDDYADAMARFILTGRKLETIYRIQNPNLYTQYMIEKSNLEKLYAKTWPAGQNIEGFLYHGTDEGTVRKICARGFDSRYCGKNAVAYGEGSYFACDMNYSAQDLYSSPDSKGKKYAFNVKST